MKQVVAQKPEYTNEYKAGYQSYERGGTKKDCTFIRGSSSYDLWMRGYNDAKEDDSREE